jgi:hypothetical protein
VKKLLGVLVAGIIVGAALAACGGAGAPAPNPTDPLISIHAEGGMCVYGSGCSRDTEILQNGSFTIKDGSGATINGQLDDATLTQLKDAIKAADFAEIKSKPFTDTCPIAFDGQKYIFTIHRDGQPEELDSCVYALDMESPLFRVDYQGTAE